jgi:hypothetical protein
MMKKVIKIACLLSLGSALQCADKGGITCPTKSDRAQLTRCSSINSRTQACRELFFKCAFHDMAKDIRSFELAKSQVPTPTPSVPVVRLEHSAPSGVSYGIGDRGSTHQEYNGVLYRWGRDGLEAQGSFHDQGQDKE